MKKRNALCMELRPTHSDKVLRDFGHALLAFVDSEIWPIN